VDASYRIFIKAERIKGKRFFLLLVYIPGGYSQNPHPVLLMQRQRLKTFEEIFADIANLAGFARTLSASPSLCIMRDKHIFQRGIIEKLRKEE